MTANGFRKLALALPGVVEAAHMGHPDFRVNGKIFATLWADRKTGMVKLTPELQREFVQENPVVFEPVNGAWGAQGATRVNLREADQETVGRALTEAYQRTATKKKK